MTTHAIRHRLLAHCHQILSLFRKTPEEALRVEVNHDGLRVLVVVDATEQGGKPGPAKYPGRFLSDAELLVWRALDGKTLTGQAIADAVGRPYDTKLKHLLMNLEDREVIHHPEDGAGYARAELVDETARR
jgi:hypothetical protein